MKKTNFILVTALTVIMLLINFSVSASEVGTYFDATKNTLQISGNLGSKAGTPLMVHISTYTDGAPEFSSTNTPMASHLIFTDDGGSVSETFPLSSQFKNNKYSVYVYATDDDGSDFYRNLPFVYFKPDSTEAKAAVKRINDAAAEGTDKYKTTVEQNALNLGIDIGEYSEHFDYAQSLTYSLKEKAENGKYTPISFRDTFFASVAVSMIKNNDDIDGAVSKYFSQFGTTADEYNNVDDTQKEILKNLLYDADYTQNFLSAIYKEKLSVSELAVATDREKFKSLLLENEIFGVSTDDATYKKIPSSYRNLVFTDMYNEKDEYKTASDVLESFNKITKQILNKYKPESSGSSGSSGSSSGGSTISGGNTNILIPPKDMPVTPQTPEAKYTDTKNHWAQKSIEFLTELGAVNGFPDNTFKPEGTVTRAEFAKMLSLSFDISAKGKADFDDVSESDWFAQSVGALAENKIILGYDGKFKPNENIKREDAAIIIYRICNMLGITLEKEDVKFTDKNTISDYALDAISEITSKGLIKGDTFNKFNPQGSLTRAEAATVIERLYTLYKGGAGK